MYSRPKFQSAVRPVFNSVSKVISRLLWFCATVHCDWFSKLVTLSQPMRNKTKAKRDLALRREEDPGARKS